MTKTHKAFISSAALSLLWLVLPIDWLSYVCLFFSGWEAARAINLALADNSGVESSAPAAGGE